jgi:hypothetical protein
MKLIRRLAKRSRGQALIEFAFILPFLTIFLFSIVDYGIALNRRLELQHAVREGARYAAVTDDEALIQERTRAQAKNIIETSDVQVCYEDGADSGSTAGDVGDSVKVYIDPPYTWDLPFIGTVVDGFFGADAGEIEMNASATARLEVVVDGATPCV